MRVFAYSIRMATAPLFPAIPDMPVCAMSMVWSSKSSQASTDLFDTAFNILDFSQGTRPHEDEQSRANKLSTSQKHVFFLGPISHSAVDCKPHSLLPHLSSTWIRRHDLLRAQLDNLLEANRNNVRLPAVRAKLRTQPSRQILLKVNAFSI